MIDIGYALRFIGLILRSKGKKSSKNLLDETVVHGRCWPSDLDLLWHMNNSRYLRECDFGRISLLIETGLWDALKQRKINEKTDCTLLVSALQAQYRQSIQLGDRFEIISRINGWDDKAFYLEQSIILDKNGQTAFSLLVRFSLIPSYLKPQMLVDDLQIGSIQSPQLSTNILLFKQNYKLNFKVIKSKI